MAYLATVQPFTDALIRTRMLLMTTDVTKQDKFNAQYREVLFQQAKVDQQVTGEDRQRASWIRATECVRKLELVRAGMDEFFQLQSRIENRGPSPDPAQDPQKALNASAANLQEGIKLIQLADKLPDLMAKASVEIYELEKELKERQ